MFPFYTPWKYLKIFEVFSEGIKWERSPEQVKQVKACIRYFSLFLKEQCFLVISNEILWNKI